MVETTENVDNYHYEKFGSILDLYNYSIVGRMASSSFVLTIHIALLLTIFLAAFPLFHIELAFAGFGAVVLFVQRRLFVFAELHYLMALNTSALGVNAVGLYFCTFVSSSGLSQMVVGVGGVHLPGTWVQYAMSPVEHFSSNGGTQVVNIGS